MRILRSRGSCYRVVTVHTCTMMYSDGMTERISATEFKSVLGERIDAAHYDRDDTIITKAGRPHAALVSYEWYRAQIEAEPNGTPLIHQKHS